MEISNNIKQCKRCKKFLSKCDFYSGRRDCKKCHNKINQDYRNKNNYNKKYYENNKEKENERSLSYYYANKNCSEQKLKWRENQLKQKYGITLKIYDDMLNSQNAKCAICNIQPDYGRGLLHVDHCHDTGKIRQLLCHHCNCALGGFRDDVEILKNAINYLKKHKND